MAEERGAVLVVAPHADDEVLGCGGAIQDHVRKGQKVYVHIVSNRVIDHKKDPLYVAETKNIAEEVAALLGVERVFYSDLLDEQLDRLLIDVIRPIEGVIEECNPGLVYAPSADDSDQDHRAVANACRVACRWVDQLRTYEIVGASRHFAPQVYLDIEPYFDTKMAAMKKYAGELRPYPNPRSLRGLEIHAQMRGLEAGLMMAEGYKVQKQIVRSGIGV
jgi:N-acetylglucosamine malate deacetylase 1